MHSHFDEIKNLKRDHEYQIKKLNDARREFEDVDPYINLNIKKERMPYHQKNMYIPLSTYSNINQVILKHKFVELSTLE